MTADRTRYHFMILSLKFWKNIPLVTSVANYGVSPWTWLPETPEEKKKKKRTARAAWAVSRYTDTRCSPSVCLLLEDLWHVLLLSPARWQCANSQISNNFGNLETHRHASAHIYVPYTSKKNHTVIPAFLSLKKKSKRTFYTLNCFKLTPIYCSVSVFLPNLLLAISLLKTASEQMCEILWNTKHAVDFVYCQAYTYTHVLTLFLPCTHPCIFLRTFIGMAYACYLNPSHPN